MLGQGSPNCDVDATMLQFCWSLHLKRFLSKGPTVNKRNKFGVFTTCAAIDFSTLLDFLFSFSFLLKSMSWEKWEGKLEKNLLSRVLCVSIRVRFLTDFR